MIVSIILAQILLHYYTHLQLELFTVLVSGYVECVKLHHIWKSQLHAVVYHLYTTARRFDLYLKCGTYICYTMDIVVFEIYTKRYTNLQKML